MLHWLNKMAGARARARNSTFSFSLARTQCSTWLGLVVIKTFDIVVYWILMQLTIKFSSYSLYN